MYQDSAGEPLYKLFRAIKHQIEKGPVDARVKKAKYTLNDTGLLGDDVEYSVLVRYTRTKKLPSRANSASKIPTRLWDCSTDTACGYRGNCPKPPQATARVCATFIFSLGVLSSRKKQPEHSNLSCACTWLRTTCSCALFQPAAARRSDLCVSSGR